MVNGSFYDDFYEEKLEKKEAINEKAKN